MGQISKIRISILVGFLLIASAAIYQRPSSTAKTKHISLYRALSDIKGWNMGSTSLLSGNIVEALELDDYINQSYSNSAGVVFLYIGYYFTSKKVGAAHDPLVCFPGQGWEVLEKNRGRVIINSDTKDIISYSTMIVERGKQRELVIYWFQSNRMTTPNTFLQKLALLRGKFSNHREDSAFVRLTTTIDGRSLSECKDLLHNFIQAFYPIFLKYVMDNSSNS